LRKKEIQSLSGPNEYNEFNNRLKAISQYHKKTPLNEAATISVPMSVEYDNLVKMIQSNDDEAGCIRDIF
jgi:splicing factor 3A subunit 3